MGHALVIGAYTLVVGVVAALLLRLLPSVRLQLAGLALVAVALPLGAVFFARSVMFHFGPNQETLALSTAAGLASTVGALILARNISRPLERVRESSVRLARGDLAERAPVEGPVELAELAASFNAMAEHLEDTASARQELVAWASHDLRAPITSLRAMLEAIEDGVVEPLHYLGALQGQVRLLDALVNDLFEMARIDSGALSLDLMTEDLAELVRACVAGFESEAQARGIELSTAGAEADDEPVLVRCATDKIERVLVNLIMNALRYTPSGGRATVSLVPEGGSVVLSVEDTGVGIAPDSLERVFEPFFRADPARNPSEGSAGLGLAIARGLVAAHGGTIWAELPPAGGTRFCVRLPMLSGPPPLTVAPLTVAPLTVAPLTVAPLTGAQDPAELGSYVRAPEETEGDQPNILAFPSVPSPSGP